MNTPDTEWEKVVTAFIERYAECNGSYTPRELREEVAKLITSRDTYWKERVGAVGDIQCENGYALAIKHFEERMQAGQSAREAIDGMKEIHRQKKALTPITNEDNLK